MSYPEDGMYVHNTYINTIKKSEVNIKTKIYKKYKTKNCKANHFNYFSM